MREGTLTGFVGGCQWAKEESGRHPRLPGSARGSLDDEHLLYRMLAEIVGVDEEPEFGPLPTGEVCRIALDISAAESELGWRPWTHLEDGLGETVAFMKGV